MATFKHVAYPSGHLHEKRGAKSKKTKHLLFGDWVKITGDAVDGWYPVHVRGEDGWMPATSLQDERLLEIVFVDVGQGDGALVVTPDDEHIVVDAGASDNMFRFLKWRYAGFKNQWKFHAAVITHPDQDHYEGFRALFETANVKFGTVYHNGIMEEFGAKASDALGPVVKRQGVSYLTHLIESRAKLRAFLAQTSRWQKTTGNRTSKKQYASLLDLAEASGRVGDLRMLSAHHSDQGYMPGFGPDRDLRIEVLGPVVHRNGGKSELRAFGRKPGDRSLDVGKTKNGHSVVLKLTYRDIKVMLGGDLNRPAEVFLLQHYSGLDHEYPFRGDHEDEIVAAARSTFEVDVAKSCHHGSSDVTDAMLRAMGPAATIISSGDEESHAHPRPETLGALGLYGRGRRPLLFSTELMRSTREDEGSAAEEIGALRSKLESATGQQKIKLQADLDKRIDELAKRNVTTYGAINLRTDGRRAVIAYRLEKPRTGSGTVTEWDIYELERAGNGPFVYSPRESH